MADRSRSQEDRHSGAELRPDSKRVTIRDVANLAEVSLGTVSRVINNRPHVGREARTRVLEAAKKLGYVPDAVAQSMRSQSSRAIGCMVSDVANPLFAKVVSAAEEITNAAGYNMILANSGDDPRRELEILTLFKRRRLDGAIMTISRDSGAEASKLLADCGIPIVLIERAAESEEIDSVASDHFQGATQALDYLFSLNHRRIGLITVSTNALPGRARVQAYKAAYQRIGMTPDLSLVTTSGFSTDYGFASAQALLANPLPPTAIIAGANQMVGVLNAVRALSIRIPEELSLISLGDTDLAQLYAPPITSIRWRSEVVGRTAAEILIGRLANPDVPQRRRSVLLPTELIVRQSCWAVPA